MRELFYPQLTFNPAALDSEKREEVKAIAALLDQLPDILSVYEAVHKDLVGKAKSNRGAKGMTAEQVVKVAIFKMRNNDIDYRELAHLTADSIAMRSFLGLRENQSLSKSTLQCNVKKISAASWKQLNDCIKAYARSQKIEGGKIVRSDTTATKTNIHYPTDASLLWDSVRVIVRILDHLKDQTDAPIKFSNHSRRVKKKDIRSTI